MDTVDKIEIILRENTPLDEYACKNIAKKIFYEVIKYDRPYQAYVEGLMSAAEGLKIVVERERKASSSDKS